MHYLLIVGITSLDYWDEVPMVSTPMCMVTHWIELTVNNDIRLSIVMIHQAIILHELSTFRG